MVNEDRCQLDFIDMQVEKIREQVGDKKVLLGLSGGVDSSVVGVLLQKAIGDQLTSIFVDHGLSPTCSRIFSTCISIKLSIVQLPSQWQTSKAKWRNNSIPYSE